MYQYTGGKKSAEKAIFMDISFNHKTQYNVIQNTGKTLVKNRDNSFILTVQRVLFLQTAHYHVKVWGQ